MRPTQHTSNNQVLGAPAHWEQDPTPCSALAITRGVEDGLPVVASFWRPSAEELAQLQAGALVRLSIVGNAMPPVRLDVEPTR